MKKKLGIAAVAFVVALLALRLGLGMYAGAKWNSYLVVWANEVKVERARAASVRRPMVHGLAPIDSNVAPLYMALFASNGTTDDIGAIASALKGGAGPESIEPILTARKADLLALREAVRYSRCDWETPWERALVAPLPNLMATRCLCNLLVIEGRGLSPREASERDLDVIRVGTDFEAGASLIHKMMAVAILQGGFEALGQTLVRAMPGELDLDQLQKDLERLAADRPALGDTLRGERLGARSFLDEAKEAQMDPIGAKIFFELGIVGIDEILREMEAALLLEPDLREKAFDEIDKKVEASLNPMVKIGIPNIRTAVTHAEDVNGTERLIATAVRLEKARAADGTYPEKLDDLPLDPGTRAPIKYQRADDGKGWTLSCKKLTLARR